MMGQAGAFFGEDIELRGFDSRLSSRSTVVLVEETEVSPAEVIDKNKDDIGFGVFFGKNCSGVGKTEA